MFSNWCGNLFWRNWTGSVIPSILPKAVIILPYVIGVCLIHNYFKSLDNELSKVVVPALGLVTGMLLVFRTNSAYDRYWEARRIWGNMISIIRMMVRFIWMMVKPDEANTPRDKREKEFAISLLIAYTYAVKNYLRGEDNQVELSQFTKQIEDYMRTGDEEMVRFCGRPMQISCCLLSYIQSVFNRGLIDGLILSYLNNGANNLMDCLAGLERIRSCQLPNAYSTHLEQALWIYMLILPFEYINSLNWFTIPMLTLCCFALLGILAIGLEIENPLGYDPNDLPLDEYCRALHHEIYGILNNPKPEFNQWYLSPLNRPLWPHTNLAAFDLVPMDSKPLRKFLEDLSTPTMSSMETSQEDERTHNFVPGKSVYRRKACFAE